MRVFTCTDHDGYWPVGVASLVVASTEDDARLMLQAELDNKNLGKGSFTLQEVDLLIPKATILLDGDY